MTLLSELEEEEALLVRYIAAADNASIDFPPTEEAVEGARMRLGVVRKLIDGLHEPVDLGGWEDR